MSRRIRRVRFARAEEQFSRGGMIATTRTASQRKGPPFEIDQFPAA